MELERKKMFHTFKAARGLAPYDELPVLREGIDPQVHLSRNDRPQPFFLVCATDTMLVQYSGEGRLELRYSSVLHYDLEVGDIVYMPAGTPHRFVPDSESVQLRYKARQPGLEGVVWFCEQCGAEVWRDEFDTAVEISQAAWWRACEEFNARPELRLCSSCGTEHPPADLTGIRWPEVAAAIAASGD